MENSSLLLFVLSEAMRKQAVIHSVDEDSWPLQALHPMNAGETYPRLDALRTIKVLIKPLLKIILLRPFLVIFGVRSRKCSKSVS